MRDLRHQLDRVCSQGAPSGRIGRDRLRRLAVHASALGLSLGQIEELLGDLVGRPQTPDRSTLGRWVRQAAQLAGRVLAVLDAHSRPQAATLCLDEIFFHGTPVLVGVEPHSFALLLCQRTGDRSGPTWEQALRPFTGLQAVCRDAGTGLSAGLALWAAGRPEGTPPLDDGLDVFHTEQEARRLLGRLWRGVEKHWAAAEEADRRLGRVREQGRDARGPAQAARAAWRKAFDAFGWYERWESLWLRAKAALGVFRPDGRLNDRAWAEAQLQAVCAELRASYWRKLVGYLRDQRTLNFLDRLHRQLAAAEPRPEVRETLGNLWHLEHRQDKDDVTTHQTLTVMRRVACAKAAGDWTQVYQRVGAVLEGVVRASSAVECVNSVLRMHQGRHRTLSQELLDLKRLYWNSRAFGSGKRKGKCPYRHLGLVLPTEDFWELLHFGPAVLAQKLSTAKAAA